MKHNLSLPRKTVPSREISASVTVVSAVAAERTQSAATAISVGYGHPQAHPGHWHGTVHRCGVPIKVELQIEPSGQSALEEQGPTPMFSSLQTSVASSVEAPQTQLVLHDPAHGVKLVLQPVLKQPPC